MTKITEEFTEEELTLFIRFSRVCSQLNITVVPEKVGDIMIEVAKESPTETLLSMVSDYKETTAGPAKNMVEIIIEELKTRGAIKCIQI